MSPLEFLSTRDSPRGGQATSIRPVPPNRVVLGGNSTGEIERFPPGSARAGRIGTAVVGRDGYDLSPVAQSAGYRLPNKLLTQNLHSPSSRSPEVQEILIRLHPNRIPGAPGGRFVDLDEGLQEWRYRHVENRTDRVDEPGTGSSSGARCVRRNHRAACSRHVGDPVSAVNLGEVDGGCLRGLVGAAAVAASSSSWSGSAVDPWPECDELGVCPHHYDAPVRCRRGSRRGSSLGFTAVRLRSRRMAPLLIAMAMVARCPRGAAVIADHVVEGTDLWPAHQKAQREKLSGTKRAFLLDSSGHWHVTGVVQQAREEDPAPAPCEIDQSQPCDGS